MYIYIYNFLLLNLCLEKLYVYFNTCLGDLMHLFDVNAPSPME